MPLRAKTLLLRHVFPGLAASDAITLLQVWLGSTLALGCIALLDKYLGSPVGLPLIIGSFGASAVLVFGAPQSPLARPRNVLGGHVISALAGVFFAQLFPDSVGLAAGLAVGSAIVLMLVTGTLHPPGGATALIAVTGGPAILALGYLYVLVPCLTGALILLGFSCLTQAVGLNARLCGACVVRKPSLVRHPQAIRRRLGTLRALHKALAGNR